MATSQRVRDRRPPVSSVPVETAVDSASEAAGLVAPAAGPDPAIAASASIRADTRYAWRGPALLVAASDGWAGAHPLTGFYFRQARFLRTLALEIQGEPPQTCSIAAPSPDVVEVSLIYPPVKPGQGGGSGTGGKQRHRGLLERGIDLWITYRVHASFLEAELTITSRWEPADDVELAWRLDADFIGLYEALGDAAPARAPVEVEPGRRGVTFRFAHPRLPLETRVAAEGGGDWTFADGRLACRLSLPRQETRRVTLRVEAIDPISPLPREEALRREREISRWQERAARLLAPGSPSVVEAVECAVMDVGAAALLEGERDEWLTSGAGFPLYGGLWGRDALVVGWQTAPFDRGEVLDAALTRVGRMQGTRDDPARDEEPGRTIQQARSDPTSRLGEVPFDRYYGDQASPFDFVLGLGQLFAWAGDRAMLDRHWDAARRILDWARTRGDMDGDGYVEYLTRSPQGPVHQGWKDSDNAVVHADGRQAEPPIAACEVQGYWFVALQTMAVLAAVRGARGDARDYWREARALKRRFNRDFWMEDEGYVALGLDRDKAPIRSITSNPGQCLATGIISKAHVPRMVRRMFQPDLFSGWGVRTLATGNAAYHPLSYHLGSVWPVENATMVFGLRRYGLDDRALELSRALVDLARLWPGQRTPECVGGWARDERAHPGAYPEANAPQSWNQSGLPLVVQALLGLQPLAPYGILAVDPVLPAWLPELTLKGLRVGGARVTLRAWRTEEGRSEFEVTRMEGALRVVRQPPLNSLGAGVWDRLVSFVDGLLPGRPAVKE